MSLTLLKIFWYLLFLCSIFGSTFLNAESWERSAGSLLTNFSNMYNPCVVEVDEEYRYKMYFFGWAAKVKNPGWPGCDAIFHARSKDLIHWEVYSKNQQWDKTMDPSQWVPILYASDKWYEQWHVGDPSVVYKGGYYHMAYSATSKHFEKVVGYPATMVQCIMSARSKDGIHWEKSKKPLLINSEDSIPPKPNPERIGDFHRPSLRWDEGKWQLWFDYWIPGKGVCMGYAESKGSILDSNSFKIMHNLKSPQLTSWPNPEVIKIGEQYHSFSDAPGYPIKPTDDKWVRRQIREAISEDGIHWKKLDHIPPDSDAEALHVPQAFMTEIDQQKWLYLFYATQIGSSKNDGKYHFRYDRIRSMRRLIK